MIIDCISDLHGHYPKLEGGDLLIVAGDLTGRDTKEEYYQFFEWLCTQKYAHKIFIGGNHDNLLEKGEICYEPENDSRLILSKTEYLCDSGTEFEDLKIWGSPWTKTFAEMNPHCKAFTVDTDEELAEKWALIPNDTEILITHCPPWGIMDHNYLGENCGSKYLFDFSRNLPNLKLFVWGHIHESYGLITPKGLKETAQMYSTKPIIAKSMPYLVNASHVNEHYQPVNKPIRIEL